MTRLVIDASVLIKLFISEEGSREAATEIKKAEALFAPDLLWAETGNILWKYVRRHDLDSVDADQLLTEMMQLPIQLTATRELIEPALKTALQTHRTVYDCLYLVLAVRTNSLLLTADERFVNALARTPFAKHIRHVTKLR
ncbi:MAG: type II toxin-antitoxin system VapC family toxin [Pirellulales bacterium]